MPTNRIQLEHQPLPPNYPAHPGLTGYLAIIHDEDTEDSIYLGFLAPHDLLPTSPGEFPGAARLCAWIARGADQHESEDGLWWLRDTLGGPADAWPTIIIRESANADPIDWPVGASLGQLQAMADAEMAAIELGAALPCPPASSPPSSAPRL